MKHLFNLLLIFLVFVIASCEKEITTPDTINASQGTYIGVVHLSYSPAMGDGDIQYVCYRMNPDYNSWDEIGWTRRTKWADVGYKLPSNKIIPGQSYEYRIRAHTDEAGFGDYSQTVTGYAFEADLPEITSTKRITENANLEIEVTLTETNDLAALQNLGSVYYTLLRKEAGTSADFQKVGELEYRYDPQNEITEFYLTDDKKGLEPGKNYIYKVIADYFYNYITVNGDPGNGQYKVEGDTVISEASGGSTPGADYTISDPVQIFAASQGGIPRIKEKVKGSTVYLGAITGAGATGYGKPVLYSYSGSSWQQVWTSDPGEEFDQINFAVGSSHSYVAGTTDSLYVFAWDGSVWSGNLTPDNLGQDDSPSGVSIETYNDELYMGLTQYPDYDLQVLKYNGSAWDTIGGDANGIIATGSIFNTEIENVDGNLYLKYIIDNTLHIKSLNGSSWDEVLSWNHEYLGDAELAQNSGDLYFIATSNALVSYPGGVYKVTGTSTVENLIPSGNEWFVDPMAIAIDSDGNVVLSSMKFESQESIYPFISIYDGSSWKSISDDFSTGLDPVGVSTINTDIYYMYGKASSEDNIGNPTVIESKKYTK